MIYPLPGVLPTNTTPLLCNFSYIRLARPKCDQSLVTGVGDGDNSLRMRWVKLGSTGCMNHADGAGSGRHVAATG